MPTSIISLLTPIIARSSAPNVPAWIVVLGSTAPARSTSWFIGRSSRLGVVTRAAGEGPRSAGIDGQCESAHEADSRRDESVRGSKEAGAGRPPQDLRGQAQQLRAF